jgi:hypothetical protein
MLAGVRERERERERGREREREGGGGREGGREGGNWSAVEKIADKHWTGLAQDRNTKLKDLIKTELNNWHIFDFIFTASVESPQFPHQDGEHGNM